MKEQTEKEFEVTITDRVETEKDLIPVPGANIKVPRPDRCRCCFRHISELEPYGKKGSDFEGVYLMKTWRYDMLIDEEVVKEMEQTFAEAEEAAKGSNTAVREWMVNKYGEVMTNTLFFIESVAGQVSSSLECRDCIVLSDEEYHEKRDKAYEAYEDKDFKERMEKLRAEKLRTGKYNVIDFDFIKRRKA